MTLLDIVSREIRLKKTKLHSVIKVKKGLIINVSKIRMSTKRRRLTYQGGTL